MRQKLHYHLIAHTVQALVDIFGYGFHTDKTIGRAFRDNPRWGARDRRQFAESLYEIVRWWRWHWHLAGLHPEDYNLPHKATHANCWLVWCAYWMQKTHSDPNFDETRDLSLDDVEHRLEKEVPPAVRAAIPDWLNDLCWEEVGPDWPDMLRTLNRPAEVYLRTNTIKIQPKPLAINLAKEEIQTVFLKDPFGALMLDKRQNIFSSRCFQNGLFEVMDVNSQAVVPFLDVKPGMFVIDACAGGGGKTLHIGCELKGKGRLLALDIHQWKLEELRKRARRGSIPNVETQLIEDNDTIRKLRNRADRVLLDVPCSGLGVLRRNPETKWRVSAEEITRLRALQADLLERYSRMTKPGGKLVYATCSILRSESEDQVRAFLAAHPDEWVMEEQQRLRPGHNGGDGFYMARLYRKDLKSGLTPAPTEAKTQTPAATPEAPKAVPTSTPAPHSSSTSSTMKPTLLILAAGMGSRYGGLKQIDPMGPSGETVLDYSVFDAHRAGFGKVVFVIRRDFEDLFREKIGSRFTGHIPVEYAFQDLHDLPAGFTVPEGRTKPWGTAHAMLSAEALIHEPCVMINADDFYGRDAFAVIAQHLQTAPAVADGRNQFCMVGFRLANTLSDHGSVARGVCTANEQGFLTSVTEMTKIFKTDSGAENREEGSTIVPLTGEEPVSMNFWGFTPAFFPELRKAFLEFLQKHGSEQKSECYVPFVVDHLIRTSQADVKVLPTSSKWFGVTYPEDKATVVASIAGLTTAGEYPTPLWA